MQATGTGPSTESRAVAAKWTMASPPLVAPLTVAGAEMTGASVSATLTRNAPRVARPFAVALHDTLVRPSGKSVPEAGAHRTSAPGAERTE